MLRTCKQKIQTCEQRRASEKYAGQKIMKYIFISGTPASGKSYLANKIANHLGVQHVSTDDWRGEMRKNRALKKGVDFFWDKHEGQFWRRLKKFRKPGRVQFLKELISCPIWRE